MAISHSNKHTQLGQRAGRRLGRGRGTAFVPSVSLIIGTSAPYWEYGLTLQQFIEARDSDFGATVAAVRQYHDWDETFPQANENWLEGSGRTVLLSIKSQTIATADHAWADIGTAANGGPNQDLYDDMVAMGVALAAWDDTIYLCFDHEPGVYRNESVTTSTAADYKAAFQNFATIIRAQASNVKMVYVESEFYYDTAQTPWSVDDTYPGDAYVDVIAVDAYSWDTTRTPEEGVDNVDSLDTMCANFLTFHALHSDKEMGIWELGVESLTNADLFNNSPAVDNTNISDYDDGPLGSGAWEGAATGGDFNGWVTSGTGTRMSQVGSPSVAQNNAVLVGESLGVNQRAAMHIGTVNSPTVNERLGPVARYPSTYTGTATDLDGYGVLWTAGNPTAINGTLAIWKMTNGAPASQLSAGVAHTIAVNSVFGIEVVTTGDNEVTIKSILNGEVSETYVDSSVAAEYLAGDTVGMYFSSGGNYRFDISHFWWDDDQTRETWFLEASALLRQGKWSQLRTVAWWYQNWEGNNQTDLVLRMPNDATRFGDLINRF